MDRKALSELAAPVFERLAATVSGCRGFLAEGQDCRHRQRICLCGSVESPGMLRRFCSGERDLAGTLRAVRDAAVEAGFGEAIDRDGFYSFLQGLLVRWGAGNLGGLSGEILDVPCPRPLGVEILLTHGRFPEGAGAILRARGLLEAMADMAVPNPEHLSPDLAPIIASGLFPGLREACLARLLSPEVLQEQGTAEAAGSYAPTARACELLAVRGYDFGSLDSDAGKTWLSAGKRDGMPLAISVGRRPEGCTRILPRHVVDDDRFLGLENGTGAFLAWKGGALPPERLEKWWGCEQAGRSLVDHMAGAGFIPPRKWWMKRREDGPRLVEILAVWAPDLKIAPEETEYLKLGGWSVLGSAISRLTREDARTYLARVLEAAEGTGIPAGRILPALGGCLLRARSEGYFSLNTLVATGLAYWDIADSPAGRDLDLSAPALGQMKYLAAYSRGFRGIDGVEGGVELLEKLAARMDVAGIKAFARTAAGQRLIWSAAGVNREAAACRDWMLAVHGRRAAARGFVVSTVRDGCEPAPFL